VLGIVLNLSESTILWNNKNSVKNMPEQTAEKRMTTV
jgi:hypothetical protein